MNPHIQYLSLGKGIMMITVSAITRQTLSGRLVKALAHAPRRQSFPWTRKFTDVTNKRGEWEDRGKISGVQALFTLTSKNRS